MTGILGFEDGVVALTTVGARIAGLVVIAPWFSHAAIPLRAKGALVVVLTGLLFPVCGKPHDESLMKGGISMLLAETLVGFLIGISVTLVFEAVHFAGQLLGIQVGLSIASVFDPQTQADTPMLSVLLQILLSLFFLGMNVHHWMLRGIADSFRYLPAGALLRGNVVEEIMRGVSAIWLIGIELSAPVLAATILTDVVVAFLGKASPQMPVLLVALPVKIVIGLGSLFAGLRFWPRIFDHGFAQALSAGERWLHLAK